MTLTFDLFIATY